MVDTWNAGGTVFNSILMNVSNGSGSAPVYAAGSKFLRLQSNGTDMMSVDPTGQAYFASNVQIGLIEASPLALLEVRTFSINKPTIKTGAFYQQCVELNNSIFAENFYFDGLQWTNVSTGYAEGLYFYNGQICFVCNASQAAGSHGIDIKMKADSAGCVALRASGSGIPVTAGTYTGATMLVTPVAVRVLQLSPNYPR